jgi:hypothetical protein
MSEKTLFQRMVQARDNEVREKQDRKIAIGEAARAGEARKLAGLLEIYEIRFQDENMRFAVVKSALDAPQDHENLDAVLKTATETNFDYAQFIKAHPPESSSTYWTLYAKQPTPVLAETGARLAAEQIRANLLKDLAWTPDLAAIVPKAKGLTGASDAANIRDSIVATQNALARFVNEEGPGQPVNQTAGFLYQSRDMFSGGMQRILTQSMSTVRHDRTSLLGGTKTNYSFKFE